MDTRYYSFPERNRDLAAECAETLKRPGAVLLVPTETVYGLVCVWNDAVGRERIYDLKARAGEKQLALFVRSAGDVEKHTGHRLPEAASRLAAAFCPGPLTIVVELSPNYTLGFRIPDHPLVLDLLECCGVPLASTSANRSGFPNALCVEDALRDLCGSPDLVVDAGCLPADAAASTVVLLTADAGWRILREGPVSSEAIAKILS